MKSSIHEFYKMSVKKRLNIIKKAVKLNKKDVACLKKASIDLETANRMIENVVGTIQLPVGIATNFIINKKELFIPMAIEEPSIIAAASHAAKLARPGGFKTESTGPIMIGQIQLVGVKNFAQARKNIMKNKKKIAKIINKKDSTMIKLGGGLKDIEIRKIKTKRGPMLIVHFIFDVRDAMGANYVNTSLECISNFIEALTGGESRLRIISNLADKRIAKAKAVWKKSVLGEKLINGILDAYEFAANDPYRCATHNKGIMNGIDAVAIATGNDFRALEAGAHAYACRTGKYKPLTKYWKDKKGNLVGYIELPVAVGIVGGSIKTNPVAQVCLKILGVKTARELGEVMAAVGLANNFAALRAMVKEGIQKGHMKLHADNIAITAGAKNDEIDYVVNEMIKERTINVSRAKEILKKLRREKRKKKIMKIEKKIVRKIKRK